MGIGEMGRHWSTKEGRQVSTLRAIEGKQKKVSKREFDTKALIESLEDEKTPMKKARLEDSVRGKKMVLKKSGGRVNLRGGGICKKGMNKKARGANS